MLKKYEKSFSNIQRFVDLFIISLSWAISYYLRFKILPDAQTGKELFFAKLAPLLIILSWYSFSQNGLYQSLRFTHRFKEVLTVVKANLFAIIGFILLIYFFGDGRISRLTLLIYTFLSTISLVIIRMTVRNYLRSLRRNGKNLRHTLLVGNGEPLLKYIENTRRFKDSGINFSGWIDSEGLADEYKIKIISESYSEFKKKQRPDNIVLSYAGEDHKKLNAFLSKYYNDIVPIQLLPDLSYSLIGHKIEDFGGVPILSVNQPSLNHFELILKRLLDILGGFIGLVLLSPLFVMIGIFIKLSSKGPILYAQERLGLGGSVFKMWKFRTMKVPDSYEDQTEWSNKDNPRKTKVGDFLRKTSLDEFPQLWNVFLGHMSLVGPRPERPFFVQKFREEIPGYMLRHKMRAGITGWAQVNGWRGDTDLNKRIECDIYYIKNWNFWFDIKILFLTFLKGFINKNAY